MFGDNCVVPKHMPVKKYICLKVEQALALLIHVNAYGHFPSFCKEEDCNKKYFSVNCY